VVNHLERIPLKKEVKRVKQEDSVDVVLRRFEPLADQNPAPNPRAEKATRVADHRFRGDSGDDV